MKLFIFVVYMLFMAAMVFGTTLANAEPIGRNDCESVTKEGKKYQHKHNKLMKKMKKKAKLRGLLTR